MTNTQKLQQARAEVVWLEAEARKESAINGKIVNLQESTKAQQAEAAKAETDNAIAVFESLGIPKAGAIEAAKGREQRGW